MREFREDLAKMGIDFDKHKNAVARAQAEYFCDDAPVFDSKEELEEHYGHPAEEILDLALWDDEDIFNMHMSDRDTTINEIIKNLNEKALTLYNELVKMPEEDWDNMLDERLNAFIKESSEKRMQEYLAKLNIDFEKHKKAAIKAEEEYFGGAPVFNTEEEANSYYKVDVYNLFDASGFSKEDVISIFGEPDDDVSFNDFVSGIEDATRHYYERLVKAPEEDWDKII